MRHFALSLRLAAVVGGLVLLVPVFAQTFFQDVTAEDHDARTITDTAYHQLMEGYPSGSFQPDAPLRQAEEVMVMARMLNVSLKGFMVLPGAPESVPVGVKSSWLASPADFLAEHGMLHQVIGEQWQPERVVTKGEFLLTLHHLVRGQASCTLVEVSAWYDDASLLPDGWGTDQGAPVTRRLVARVLENLLNYLTQNAVTKGRIVKYDTDTDENRWVTLETPIGEGRLVLPTRGVIVHNGEADDLKPGVVIETLSDAVTGQEKPYYRVREATVLK